MAGYRGNLPLWWESCDFSKVEAPKLVDKCLVMEQKEPWRHGVGITLRLPFSTLGIAFGYWKGEQETESDEFGYLTLKMRVMDVDDWEKF